MSILLSSIILIRRNNLNIKAIYAPLLMAAIVLIVLTVLTLLGDY